MKTVASEDHRNDHADDDDPDRYEFGDHTDRVVEGSRNLDRYEVNYGRRRYQYCCPGHDVPVTGQVLAEPARDERRDPVGLNPERGDMRCNEPPTDLPTERRPRA